MNIQSVGHHAIRTIRLCLGGSYVLWNPELGLRCSRGLSRTYCNTGLQTHYNNALYLNSNNFLFSGCTKQLRTSARFLSQEQTENAETSLEQTHVTDTQPQDLETPSTTDTQVPPSRIRPLGKNADSCPSPLAEVENVDGGWEDAAGTGGQQHHEQVYELLRKCRSPSDVLDLAGNYTLNLKRLSNCFTTMWEVTKKMSEEQRRYEKKLMFEHPVFEQLCLQVMQEARGMMCDDLAYSMLAVVKLGVSPRSRLVQTLLRVSQERLNEFDERGLSILANCLEDMDSSKNAEALRAGLRMLIELRVPRIRGVLALQTIMRAVGKDASPSLKKKLETKALSMLDQFSLPNAQYMFATLAAINLRSLPLLKVCSDKIVENIHGIPFWRLVSVLRACRDLQYRNLVLFSAVADYVASTIYMWQNKQAVLFLSLFEDLGFRHIGLLDVFVGRVIDKPDSLTLKEMLSVLRAYSLLNHLPEVRSQEFLEALSNGIETYLPKIPTVELLRAVYSFCILGHFPPTLFNALLQEDVLNELLTTAGQSQDVNARMLHSVNVCLELDNPLLAKPLSQAVTRPTSGNVSINPAVQQALQSILGDDRFFQQAVQLQMDYYIDFEIALDKERKNVIPLCAAERPNGSQEVQRVAVVCASTSAFCYGTTHPRGKLAMKLRHLTALGYHIALIPEHHFERMKEDERVHFLKSKIYGEQEASESCPAPDQELGE